MQKKTDIFEYIKRKPSLGLIIGSVIFVIGILISDIPKMFMSQGWPTTMGTILYHTRTGQRFKEYDGDIYTNIEVYIRYQYAVDGITYTSLSIDSIDKPFKLYPTSYADRYPVGKDVIVYYNPKHPSEALLEPGFVNIVKAFDIYSYITFGLGIYFIHLGVSRMKENRFRKNLKSSLRSASTPGADSARSDP